MSRILVCKDNQKLLLTKDRAFKYKTLDFLGVKCGQAFSIEDNDNSLKAVAEELNTQEEPIYSVVTKEFGLYAMSTGVSAKIKVSFCDDGYMIVDVLEGAILIKPEDDILLASRGISDLPNVHADGIEWVNADKLLSFKQFWGSMKDKYIQDFEYVFTIRGEVKGGLSSFGLKIEPDEVIDISGGAIATIEANAKMKEEAKQVKNSFKEIVNSATSGYEFDDDDDEDEEEYIEQEDDDFDDGSNY